jgi:hypothetical protein
MPSTAVTNPISNRVGFINTLHVISGLPHTPISFVGKRITKIPTISVKIERNLLDSNSRLKNKRTPAANSNAPSPISARDVHKHFMGMFFPLGSLIAFPSEAQV